jgi:hypothetical protein
MNKINNALGVSIGLQKFWKRDRTIFQKSRKRDKIHLQKSWKRDIIYMKQLNYKH